MISPTACKVLSGFSVPSNKIMLAKSVKDLSFLTKNLKKLESVALCYNVRQGGQRALVHKNIMKKAI